MDDVRKATCDPVEPRWTISTFRTRRVSSSDLVYINGLQQIKVEVELLALDSSDAPVMLSHAERESITIALYGTGSPLPRDSEEEAGWVVSPGVDDQLDERHYHGYLFHPTGLEPKAIPVEPSSQAPTNLGTHYRYVFLACRSGVPQKVRLCAHVTCDDGWIYRTNGTDTDNCGVDNDSSVIPGTPLEVESKSPDVYPIEHYPFVKMVDSGGPGNPAFVHHYRLSFVDMRGNEVGLRKMELAPRGMIQWQDKVPGEEFRASFTGYAEPASTEVNWNERESVPVGSSPVPTLDASHVSTTKGIVLLVGRDDIPYESGHSYAEGPCMIGAVDAYGNTAQFSVSFKDKTAEGRLELVHSLK